MARPAGHGDVRRAVRPRGHGPVHGADEDGGHDRWVLLPPTSNVPGPDAGAGDQLLPAAAFHV